MNKYYKTVSLTTILRVASFILLLFSNHILADPFVDLLNGLAASVAKGGQNNQQTANGKSSDSSGSTLATPHSQDNQQIEEAQRLELAKQGVLANALVKDFLKTHSFSDREIAKEAIEKLIADLRANAKIENISSAETVAIVNGIPIPQARINLRVKAAAAQGQADSPELRKAIMEDMINMEVMSQEAVKKGLGKQAEIPASTTQNPSASSSSIDGYLTDSTGYCAAIESNETVRATAKTIAAAHKQGDKSQDLAVSYSKKLFDNDQGQLIQWVKEKVTWAEKKHGWRYSPSIYRWAALCAAKHVNDDLFYFFAEGYAINDIRDQVRTMLNEHNKKKTILGQDGKFEVVVNQERFDTEGLVLRIFGLRFLNGSDVYDYRQASFIAIAVPGGSQALASTSAEGYADFLARLENAHLENLQKKVAAEKQNQSKKIQTDFVNISFDDFWLDKATLAGKNVHLAGFGSYAGDMMFMTKKFGAANMIYVDVGSLPRQNIKRLLETCSPYCNINVWGEVRMNMLGNAEIRASRVTATKY